MGMDVVGRNNPDAYFRNNVWWWRPLWDYCCEVGAGVIDGETAEVGHFNDGSGLDEDGALKLAAILRQEIGSGRTFQYERQYNAYIASLPRSTCVHCAGTGVRTDGVGLDAGMPSRELSPEVQIITGRTHGWCNGCSGEGKVDSFEAHYPFSVENVAEFADFLEECGGFHIY